MFKRFLTVAPIVLLFLSVFSIYAVNAGDEIEILGPAIHAGTGVRPRCDNSDTSCGDPGECVDLTGMVFCERGRVVKSRCLSNNIRNETLTSSCDGGSFNFRFASSEGEGSNVSIIVYEQDTSNIIGKGDIGGEGAVNSLDAIADMDVNFMDGEFTFLMKGVDFSAFSGDTPEVLIDKVTGAVPGATVYKTLYVDLPNGLTYTTIILKIDYSDITTSNITLYKCADFDPLDGMCDGNWIVVPTIKDSVNKVVIAEINSFSAYSLGGSGGDTTGQDCYQDSDCNDGLYCNGVEVCTEGVCAAGQAIDCSANDLTEIATCSNDPDGNPFTWDSGIGESVCDEDTDSCTEPTSYTYTHSCNIGSCGAECASDSDCVCPNDKCVGDDYYDYPDKGDCLSDCSCDVNTGDGRPCEPNIIESHSACVQSTSGSTGTSTSSAPSGGALTSGTSSGTDSGSGSGDSGTESGSASTGSSGTTDTTSPGGETSESDGSSEESDDISGRATGFTPTFNTYMLIVIPIASMVGAFTYNFFRKNENGYQSSAYKSGTSRNIGRTSRNIGRTSRNIKGTKAKASRPNRKTRVQRKKKQQTKIVLNL